MIYKERKLSRTKRLMKTGEGRKSRQQKRNKEWQQWARTAMYMVVYMIDTNIAVSAITVNVNGPNMPIKKQRQWLSYMLSIRNPI